MELQDLIQTGSGEESSYGGEDLLGLGAQKGLGILFPGMPMLGNFAPMLMPYLRDYVGLKNDPFTMFGGIGSTWNVPGRYRDWKSLEDRRLFEEQANQNVRRIEEDEYIRTVMRREGENAKVIDALLKNSAARQAKLVEDNRFSVLKTGMAIANRMSGSRNIARGMFTSGLSMGLLRGGLVMGPEGGEAGDYKNEVITRRNLSAITDLIQEAFITEGSQFGSLKGGEVGDLFASMAREGGLGNLISATGGGGTYGITKNRIAADTLSKLKKEISETSGSLSAIKDILHGSVPQVIDQLKAIFGDQGVQGVGGIKSAADSLNKMRIMSQMTGTSLENMIQYTQASGMLSKQIIGSTVGSAVSGEMISAIMASAAKGVWGVDDQVLGQVMTQRVTGAQLSQVSQGTAALLNLADKANISAERKEKLKAALMDAARNSPNPLTMEDIADIGKKYGVDISGQQLYQMTGLESTIKRAADDPTGTNVALANQAGQILSQRRDVLKAHLKKAGIAWRDDYAKMSLENIQKETQNNQNVNWKTVKTTLDNVADSLGRENDATAMAAIEATERAQRLQAAVDAEQRLASKPIYQAFGGGIAGVMKAFGAGKIGDADFKDLAFVFFGGLSEEQNKKAQKWLKGKQNDKNWMASVTGETSAIQTLTELVVGKTKEGTDLRNDRLNNLKGLMTPAQQIEYDKATTAEEKAAIIYDALKTSDDAEIEAAFGKDYKASQAFKNIKAGTGYGQKRRQDILNKAREAISIGKTLEGYEFLATNAQELFKNKLKYEEYLHESDPEKLEALAKEIKLSDGRSLYAKDAAHRKREKALEVELNKNSAQEKLRAAIADEWGTDILGTGSNDKKRKALLGYLTKAGGEDLFGKMNENERSRLRHDPEVFKEFIENNKGSIKRKLSGEEATAFLEEADKASERTSEDTMNEILAALKPIGDYFRDANKTLDSTIEDIKLAIKHVNIFSFLGADPLGGMR